MQRRGTDGLKKTERGSRYHAFLITPPLLSAAKSIAGGVGGSVPQRPPAAICGKIFRKNQEDNRRVSVLIKAPGPFMDSDTRGVPQRPHVPDVPAGPPAQLRSNVPMSDCAPLSRRRLQQSHLGGGGGSKCVSEAPSNTGIVSGARGLRRRWPRWPLPVGRSPVGLKIPREF